MELRAIINECNDDTAAARLMAWLLAWPRGAQATARLSSRAHEAMKHVEGSALLDLGRTVVEEAASRWESDTSSQYSISGYPTSEPALMFSASLVVLREAKR